MKKWILIFVACLSPVICMAQMPDMKKIRSFKVGNGGDSVVLEFQEILRNVYAQLEAEYGPTDEIISGLNLELFGEVFEAPIKSYDEVRLNGVELDAVNDPLIEKEIALSRPRWNTSSNEQRYRIVLHETLLYLGFDDKHGDNSSLILRNLIIVPFHNDGRIEEANLQAQDLTKCFDGCVQISSKNASKFAKQVAEETEYLLAGFKRQKELSIQAANGAVGSTERGFLNDEFQAYKDEMLQVIKMARFEDMFLNKYFYLQNGFNFSVPIEMFHGRYHYLKEFKFPDLKHIGERYTVELQIAPGEGSPSSLILTVDDKHFMPSINKSDDTASVEDPLNSAISIASAFNAFSRETGVYADIDWNVVKFKNLRPQNWPAMESGDLIINGVEIVGSAYDLENLAALIFEYYSSTGVKAEIESSDVLKIYSTDGRNIDIQSKTNKSGQNFAKEIGLSIEPDEVNIFYGKVYFFSSRPFYIQDAYGIFGQMGELYSVVESDPNTYRDSSLSDLASAQDAVTTMEQVIQALEAYQVQLDMLMRFCPDKSED